MLFTNSGNGSVVKGIHRERFNSVPFAKLLLCIYFNISNINLLQTCQATAYVTPQLWQPPSGSLMTNDINDSRPPEDSPACIALSKNDSYVMSASGGKVSLFNMMTFKVSNCSISRVEKL